ncbi:MAG: HAD family hydrolase [Myxacorys californica WJT36-NPBG1]|nr:HAD family hydrolase [Myxacorys californica WJT36-NPBG1]
MATLIMITLECNGVRFQNVQAIVWDKDGTLADSLGFLRDLGQKRAQAVEAEVPGLAEAILRSFGFTAESLNPAGLLAVGTRLENEIGVATVIAQTGRDWIASLTLARSAFEQVDQGLARKADLTPPFDGIVDLLRSLHNQPVKLAILSSDSQTNVEDFVDRHELRPYFQQLVGARVGISKPAPQLLQLVCTSLNVDLRHTLVIGDAIGDIQLATNSGALGSIGVTWGGVTPAQLDGATAIAHQVNQIRLLQG